MKRALIDPRNNRLCQVEPKEFSVAEPLYWMGCADEVTPETHHFDGAQIVVNDPPPKPPTIDEQIAQEASGRVLIKGLIRMLAERFNVTEQQVIDKLIEKAKL